MDIGKKLRQARLDAGLSQRQLCGGQITRNMLSQIENGAARPSMETLRYLAGQLNKPISFFLEESGSVSLNANCMEKARKVYADGAWSELENYLKNYQAPDTMFDDEYGLLKILLLLAKAESVLDRPIYVRQLLDEAAQQKTCYMTRELEQQRLLLLAQVSQETVDFPADDRPLFVRAKAALAKGDGARCVALLEACEDRNSVQWHYLRAEAAFALGEYAVATEHYPEDCYAKLEECYRNLGDYKKAYEYACKQR